MKIVYATRAAIPYPSAASWNTVQMCQALRQLGHEVTLAIGRKFWRRTHATLAGRQSRQRAIESYYGVLPWFQIKAFHELPRTGLCFDRRIVQLARRTEAVLYTRYPRILRSASMARVTSILEIHTLPNSAECCIIDKALARGWLRGIVVLTEALKHDLCHRLRSGAVNQQVIVASDAVDPNRFRPATSRGMPRIGYVGSMYPGKGHEMVRAVAARMPAVAFDVYGVTSEQLSRWAFQCPDNLTYHVRRSPAEMPEVMNSFQIAMVPNQPSVQLPNGVDIGRYTSPMKLFESMASGHAIVASDLAIFRDCLRDGDNCLLAKHDDPTMWATKIQSLIEDECFRRKLGHKARFDAVTRFTFERRFRRILNSIFAETESPSRIDLDFTSQAA